MGDPRRLKKKFKKPRHPYEKERISEELQFIGKYGLRNKKEFWRHRSQLGDWRNIARQSRSLPAARAAEVQQTLIKKLQRLGVLGPHGEFDDILLITPEDILRRRLQTMVFEKGFAKTIYEARQRIVHGHIQVGNKKIDSPSYLVKKEEEDLISYVASSPFATTTKVEEKA